MEQANTKTGSYFKAICLAFLLGLGGVIIYVILGAFLMFISGWISALTAYLLSLGYKIAKGPKKGRIPILLGLYLFQVFISVYLMYYLQFVSGGVPVSFGDVIPLIIEVVRTYPETSVELFIVLFFAAFGIVLICLYDRNSKRSSKYHQSANIETALETRSAITISFEGDFRELNNRFKETLHQRLYYIQPYGPHDYIYRNNDSADQVMKCIKFAKIDNTIKISAFIIAQGKESSLEGETNFAAKQALRELVNELVKQASSI
ncbi:MAG: hypothetical protein LBR37_04325 [Erysipelotrichaceae bacterium]|jgi:hypothetical protein|nr:hypothetical protein [Erysipelotrichaceae bacterium]